MHPYRTTLPVLLSLFVHRGTTLAVIQLNCSCRARSIPTTSGAKPSARYGHSVTLIPAKRNIIVLGGTDGKQLEHVQSTDPEYPPHKTTKSLHAMTVYMLDVDSEIRTRCSRAYLVFVHALLGILLRSLDSCL